MNDRRVWLFEHASIHYSNTPSDSRVYKLFCDAALGLFKYIQSMLREGAVILCNGQAFNAAMSCNHVNIEMALV